MRARLALLAGFACAQQKGADASVGAHANNTADPDQMLFDPDQPWRRSNPTIRLVSDLVPMDWGTQCADGRIEIWHQGGKWINELAWGTVCNTNFKQPNVDVVCKMMGFKYGKATWSYYKKTPREMYGTGYGQIWLDEIDCDGSEWYIAACKHSLWGKVGCDHQSEAGVICSDNPLSDSSSLQNDCAAEKTLAERCAENPGECEGLASMANTSLLGSADAAPRRQPRYFYGKGRMADGSLIPEHLQHK